MIRFPSIVAAVVTGALIVVSCGADVELALPDTPSEPTPSTQERSQPTPRPTPTPSPTPAGRAPLADDQFFEQGPRIAVTTSDDQLFTMLGDGSNIVPLTSEAEGTVNALPTWSQDASVLAWATTNPAAGNTWVRSARFDGSAWFEQAVPQQPLYLAWDPTSSQVATLAPGETGLDLGMVSLADESFTQVDDGSPFWFSWNPDGDGFLVHASGLRLDLVPTAGPTQVLEQNPGRFQAPRWLSDPPQLLYADEIDDQNFLVVAGTEGAGRRALVRYDGYLQFVVAPQSGWIALHVIDPALAPVPDVITASFQNDVVDVVDPVPRNELTVIATFGGDPFVVYPGPDDFSPSPVVAFYWSPDGSTLAWLVQLDPGDGDCASETARLQWQFMLDNSVVTGPEFFPTGTFACDYLPFFDQLDQSVSFWSPDGTVLTYAGTDTITGERGIWNVDVGGFSAPSLVADGEIAVWSPEAAGSAGRSAL